MNNHQKNTIDHPYLKPMIERRLYQEMIFGCCVKGNTLVILPTGLGKTVIAVMLAVHRLEKFPESHVVFLAPTRPLVNQHYDSFQKFLTLASEDLTILTGTTKPELRKEQWEKSRVAFMTPQVLENDLISGKYTLKDVSLLIFDECHRAVKKYAYTFIAEKYREQAKNPLILGITASPGSEKEKIEEICNVLDIENVEIRTDKSPDVEPYIHPLSIEWKKIPLPKGFGEIKTTLESVLKEHLKILKEMEFIDTYDLRRVSRTDLIRLQAEIQNQLHDDDDIVDPQFLGAIALVANAIRISYTIELLETQGLKALNKYIEQLEKQIRRKGGSRVLKEFMADNRTRKAIFLIKELLSKGQDHPKAEEIKKIVKEQLETSQNSRILVFAQFRITAKLVASVLDEIEGVNAVRFVGQSKRKGEKGLSQKEQAEILKKFKHGEYNVLVATSVAEEGLDIAECDLVIFYDTVPSEIRNIQRRGRTARKSAGKVIVLMAKGTRDEAYYWVAQSKEREMNRLLNEIKGVSKSLKEEKEKQKNKTLDSFFPEDKKKREEEMKELIEIIVDNRERASQVLRNLSKMGFKIHFKQLQIADYILSSRVGVERKIVTDFLQSLIDGRLLDQIIDLKTKYQKPLLLIEGEDLYGKRALHPEAIRGALMAISISLGVPIQWTKNEEETAQLLSLISKEEKKKGISEIKAYTKRETPQITTIQENVIAGIPGVDTVLAKRLLWELGTIERIFTSDEEHLKEIKGIGPKLAEIIREIASSEYTE
ncbi:DEAD/DEAH box helicase [Candidatus Borrarchaeum sp.]|uniref:DEAD/DEAH box helicase n=1 Tax=Candidatus Borrarchaeum sp. TaxID=2846742 RepID=UPI00258076C6|nr:DEAD/DEAH box helicase [Candidatus Borrarchaeum sp.]